MMVVPKNIAFIIFVVLTVGAFFIFSPLCNTARKMEQNLHQTIYEEFKPEELLRKYEWFKDAASQMDQKLSTLKTYEIRFADLKKSYGPDSLIRSKWSRTDQEQSNIWHSEYTGVKASYNELAANYNAAMVKFNYRFCNAGDLPKGADMVLPREFREYIE